MEWCWLWMLTVNHYVYTFGSNKTFIRRPESDHRSVIHRRSYEAPFHPLGASYLAASPEGILRHMYSNLGTCTKTKARFQLNEDARHVFCRKRRVAYAAKDTIEKGKRLDRPEQSGVVEKKCLLRMGRRSLESSYVVSTSIPDSTSCFQSHFCPLFLAKSCSFAMNQWTNDIFGRSLCWMRCASAAKQSSKQLK